MHILPLLMILAQGADVTTTALALNRGCHEAVLPSQSPLRIGLVKGGMTVGFVWTVGRLNGVSKPASRIVAGTVIALGATAAIWNARQLSHCKGVRP